LLKPLLPSKRARGGGLVVAAAVVVAFVLHM
jgi:hypothetical protein